MHTTHVLHKMTDHTTQNYRSYYRNIRTYHATLNYQQNYVHTYYTHTYMYYVLVMYYTITCVTSFIYVCLQQLTKKLKKRLAILADILNVAGYIYRASTIHYIFVMQ